MAFDHAMWMDAAVQATRSREGIAPVSNARPGHARGDGMFDGIPGWKFNKNTARQLDRSLEDCQSLSLFPDKSRRACLINTNAKNTRARIEYPNPR
jgi:hypothetical protein